MLLRESIEPCPACGEVTPHVRRVVALPIALAAASVLAGGALLIAGRWLWPLAVVLGVVAALLLLRDRERGGSIRCTRCRGKHLRALRERKPTLDGRTIIDLP